MVLVRPTVSIQDGHRILFRDYIAALISISVPIKDPGPLEAFVAWPSACRPLDVDRTLSLKFHNAESKEASRNEPIKMPVKHHPQQGARLFEGL